MFTWEHYHFEILKVKICSSSSPEESRNDNHRPLVVYAPGIQVLPDGSRNMQFESEVRSGFQPRNVELKNCGVLGSEGDNPPFSGARTNLTSYSDFSHTKPQPLVSWHPRQFLTDLSNRIGFWPEQQPRSERKYCSVRVIRPNDQWRPIYAWRDGEYCRSIFT